MDQCAYRSLGVPSSRLPVQFCRNSSDSPLFSGTDFFLQKVFRKRPLIELTRMDLIQQHGYILLTWLRQALALGIAVNLAVLPLSLYCFHKFPWMSLLYNLFFPFMVSISMVLLLAGLSLSLIPFAGELIHGFNSAFTRFLLNFTSEAPPFLDLNWRISEFPAGGLIVYLSLLFFTGLLLKLHIEKHDQTFLIITL